MKLYKLVFPCLMLLVAVLTLVSWVLGAFKPPTTRATAELNTIDPNWRPAPSEQEIMQGREAAMDEIAAQQKKLREEREYWRDRRNGLR